MIYSEEHIEHAANQVINNIIKLIGNKWIGDIYNTYLKVVDEVLYKFGVVAKELDQERYNRLFLELISYSLSLIIFISSSIFLQKKKQFLFSKEEVDLEGKLYFRNAVASITEEKIIDLKIDQIKELVLIKYEPEIKFGYSEKNIYFWDRVEEYAKIQLGMTKKKSEEIEVFGKYIGKALDPEHYPSLEIIGLTYANKILVDTYKELKNIFV